ncbi:ABC transporter substrate-binding protein [Vogesella sp. LIG4]|uniref:ABC transporter substrate-binding protein n=1 Tax=Vogesella sp. LIG4 TaxID=1192162 RepID=UPI00081FCF46|nr:ABC transporter substrate-binding protein [Vogesella sp. LIG4]SCK25577.1 histidine transport system substrate-binding protein [Vogesella sp. LIG4]
MKKLTLAIMLACAAGTVAAKDWKVIRFGVNASYAPFESRSPSGQLIGFDIDLGNALCAKLKARCVWVENAWDGIIPGLQAKKFDAILSSMAVTDKRLQQISFTEKIYNVPPRLVAKKGSTLLPTIEQLRGKRIGVEQGSTSEAYAKAYWEPQGVTVSSYQTQDQVYQDLTSGRVDAAFQSSVQADIGFLKTAAGRDYAFAGGGVSDAKILGVGAAIGLRKDDGDLAQLLNRALNELHKDGTYQRISQKYFSFDIY